MLSGAIATAGGFVFAGDMAGTRYAKIIVLGLQ